MKKINTYLAQLTIVQKNTKPALLSTEPVKTEGASREKEKK